MSPQKFAPIQANPVVFVDIRVCECHSRRVTDPTTHIDDTVHIRPVQPGDHIPDDLPTPGPDEDGPHWRRSLLAQIGNHVVGTASLLLSTVTDSYFCEIDITASDRRHGIGRQLYKGLHELRDQPFPVLIRAMRSRPLRRVLADEIGCAVRTQCPAPWIDPPTDEVRDWIARQPVPDGYATVTMSEQPTDKVLQAWTTCYVGVHAPFGTVHRDRVPLAWEGYSSTLDPVASILTLDRAGTIVAFSLVSPEVWDGRTMIVAETVQLDQPDGTDLLKTTVATSLAVLAQRGTHRVQLEGHTTDPHIPALIDSLPSQGSDPMDILELDPPAA